MYITAYNFLIAIYYVLIKLFSFFNPKAKKWIAGRKNWRDELKRKIHLNEKYVWFHCASVGEFEQGRPLIEKIREEYPQYKIILTFFSPSGYELRKNYQEANHVIYLPLDTAANARDFIRLVNPVLVVFVKYEIWVNYLSELKRRDIPVVLISAKFRVNQIFFRWYGKLFLDALRNFKMIFVQDKLSYQLLAQKEVQNIFIANDTRFDRVIAIAKQAQQLPLIETFSEGEKQVIVCGSTWSEDEHIITQYINNNSNSKLKWIIVPHEIDAAGIKQLRNNINQTCLLYSEFELNTEIKNFNVLIIDRIGMLSSIYRYAKITYVGGGFGKGIHNTLEAAVYNKPVLFGTHYHKFLEAEELIECGAAFAIRNYNEFERTVNILVNDEIIYNKSSLAAGDYVMSKAGGTDMILNKLKEQHYL